MRRNGDFGKVKILLDQCREKKEKKSQINSGLLEKQKKDVLRAIREPAGEAESQLVSLQAVLLMKQAWEVSSKELRNWAEGRGCISVGSPLEPSLLRAKLFRLVFTPLLPPPLSLSPMGYVSFSKGQI